jgi:hypothetical protein
LSTEKRLEINREVVEKAKEQIENDDKKRLGWSAEQVKAVKDAAMQKFYVSQPKTR